MTSGSVLTREVPWDDLADDTDRLMTGVSELVLVSLDRLSLDLIGPTSVIANGTNRSSDVDGLGPVESFAYHTQSSASSNPTNERMTYRYPKLPAPRARQCVPP